MVRLLPSNTLFSMAFIIQSSCRPPGVYIIMWCFYYVWNETKQQWTKCKQYNTYTTKRKNKMKLWNKKHHKESSSYLGKYERQWKTWLQRGIHPWMVYKKKRREKSLKINQRTCSHCSGSHTIFQFISLRAVFLCTVFFCWFLISHSRLAWSMLTQSSCEEWLLNIYIYLYFFFRFCLLLLNNDNETCSKKTKSLAHT